MTIILGILGVFWLLGLIAGGLALRASLGKPIQRPGRSILLATVALGIGAVGFLRPLPLWPDLFIGSFQARWVFLAPLALGLIALILIIRNRASGRAGE
jgi:hypothetical protein